MCLYVCVYLLTCVETVPIPSIPLINFDKAYLVIKNSQNLKEIHLCVSKS